MLIFSCLFFLHLGPSIEHASSGVNLSKFEVINFCYYLFLSLWIYSLQYAFLKKKKFSFVDMCTDALQYFVKKTGFFW